MQSKETDQVLRSQGDTFQAKLEQPIKESIRNFFREEQISKGDEYGSQSVANRLRTIITEIKNLVAPIITDDSKKADFA